MFIATTHNEFSQPQRGVMCAAAMNIPPRWGGGVGSTPSLSSHEIAPEKNAGVHGATRRQSHASLANLTG